MQIDDDATLIAFVGRWTFEKGIDLIVDLCCWLLTNWPNVQVMVIGPVGDYFGQYAADRTTPSVVETF